MLFVSKALLKVKKDLSDPSTNFLLCFHDRWRACA